jgi:glycosyltransferase involved in cell wall biosynthesis
MQSRPVRVLQIIDTFSMGGAETWLIEALRLWARNREVQSDFLLTSGNRGIFDDEAAALGAKLHYLSYNRRNLPAFIRGFRRILRQNAYDAIHDHQDYTAGWHFMMGGRHIPSRRIVHVHNPSYTIRLTYGVTAARRATIAVGKWLIARYATHLAGTSRQILTEFGFDAPVFRYIPKSALYCGFDTSRFVGSMATKVSVCHEFDWSDGAHIILVAGRMDESPDLGHPRNHKNTGFALNVVMAAMKRAPDTRAIFVGKKSAATSVLEARVKQAGLAGRIVFTGVRTDIADLMQASDLLLFPSRGEGLGMVAVEAQAAGLPVLASTAVPRECLVIPGRVEFLDVGQEVDVWAQAALRLMQLPRDAYAANRLVSASAFSIEKSTAALADLYRDGLLSSGIR